MKKETKRNATYILILLVVISLAILASSCTASRNTSSRYHQSTNCL
jgi:hypothetical protein